MIDEVIATKLFKSSECIGKNIEISYYGTQKQLKITAIKKYSNNSSGIVFLTPYYIDDIQVAELNFGAIVNNNDMAYTFFQNIVLRKIFCMVNQQNNAMKF